MWGLSSDVKIQKLFSSRLVTHTGEKTHQIKAGWILDEENNVKMSRPKGENFIIFITCLFVKSIDSASRSVMLADGRPFESFKTAQCTAMHEVSTFWKNLPFFRSFRVAGAGIIIWFLLPYESRIRKKESSSPPWGNCDHIAAFIQCFVT